MRKISLLLFVVISLSARAQTLKTDSLLTEIQKSKADTNKVLLYEGLLDNYHGDPNEMIKYAADMMALSEKLNYDKGIAWAYNYKGAAYSNKKLYKYANACIDDFYAARNIFEAIGDKQDLGKILANIGQLYCRIRKYTCAMDTLLKAKQLLEESNDSSSLTYTYYWLGCVYLYKKEYTVALEQYSIAKSLCGKNGNTQTLSAIYIQMAVAFAKQRQCDTATSYATSALNMAKEISYTEAIADANKCLEYIHKRE